MWRSAPLTAPALLLLLLAAGWPQSLAAPVAADDRDAVPPAFALDFMKQYGYLDPSSQVSESLYKNEDMVEVIKQVQRFGALNQTGILDNATLQLMKSPRCGVPDIKHTNRTRSKRYIVGSDGWKKRHITYFIANWSPKIGEEAVVEQVQRAFSTWAGYARLNFSLIADPAADIIIAFGRGPHGDPFPFDGPGSILAHAYYPYEMDQYGGDVHFDEDENWKVKLEGPYDDGVDFFTVAVHELGHSLGLAHSDVPSSIMFPYYKGFQESFQLGYDDILAMYDLYISRSLEDDNEINPGVVPSGTDDSDSETQDRDEDSNHVPDVPSTDENSSEGDDETHHPVTPTAGKPQPRQPDYPTSTGVTFEDDYETVDEHREHERHQTTEAPLDKSDPCLGNYDAVSVLRGELFFFKGEMMWRMSGRGLIQPGYPVNFRHMFWRFPNTVTKIDAVYQRDTDSSIVFFTGNKFWVFNGETFIEGSPQPITALGLPASLTHLDAAMVWGKNGKTFFYSGDQYWRFNETTKLMDPGYPKNISRWRGVPQNLDAAMTWTDGLTYFFKDKLFWRFNNMLIKTDDQYPLPAPTTWFGCPP
ncbi:matrix metalloproteinase-14-like isoform X1 [Schistocerca cancellata]|uniref:matrix metalloproteinase-14-like isoform X1 n=1 Tax=Schistocerca cancellata TaxID=274614 RepID=UPI0021196280|nr:matrix metalloproteinase-14-like isoform X1 [Schistocerca cancellata]